jgi:Zn-dependent protease
VEDSLRLGRIFGIRVGLNWSLLLVFLLLAWSLATGLFPAETLGQSSAAYWTAGVIAAVLFLASLLAHELAHAVVAQRMGVRVDGITLWLFGGVARLSGSGTLSRIKSVPSDRRQQTRVRDIACPISEVPTAQVDEPLVDVMGRMGGCSEGRCWC